MTGAGLPQVDVFTVVTDGVPDDVIDALATLLTADETARRARFLRTVDQRTFVLTRALIRMTLSTYGPTRPRDWRFATNQHGCPAIVESQAGVPRLAFNVSHTHGLVALAVTRGHLVGVDVERVDRVVRDDIAGRYFAPSEVRDLRALPAAAQPRAFFDYWTLKEAYIKARGFGLALPLGDFAFHLSPGGAPSISIEPSLNDDPATWQFLQDWPTPIHRLGLAIRRTGEDLPVRMRQVVP
jgi:4'-phosphopantetheinyl transferase